MTDSVGTFKDITSPNALGDLGLSFSLANVCGERKNQNYIEQTS